MEQNDKDVGVAARIADGSAIDWRTSDATDDQALLEQLKAIAQVAALHRAPAWPVDAPPETWGSLTILSSVGAGRFGDVFLSWDARLHRRVALKLLHNASSSLASPDRAIEEARLLARVRHPNVLTVYGAECINGRVGIWTEFVEGRTLEALVQERDALDAAEVTEIGINLCRALAAVHEAGLLHRDIKAQNVMRETGGRIVLMDFGAGHDLALAPARDGDLTGTPLYLAPELFAGGQHSHATDIYAVAVLLHYLLTGDYPISGSTLDEVRAGHVSRTRTRLRDRRAELPASLLMAIERGLSSDAANRFKTAHELERALAETPSTAASKSAGSSRRRARALMILAAVGLVAVVALGTWQLLGNEPQSQPQISQTAARQNDLPLPLTVVAAPDVPERPPIQTAQATGIGGDRLLLGNGNIGSASRDGRFLALPGNDATLWIRDLSSSEPPRRVNTGSETGRGLETPEFSHDGRWLAYAWTPPGSRIARLVIADASLSNIPPRVVFDSPDISVWLVHDWRPDGSAILVTLQEPKGGNPRLAWISTADGSVVTLKEILPGTAVRPIVRVSPDGRFVAYAAREPALTEIGNPSNQYIYLIASDASRTEAIVKTAASSENPVWSPDGSFILYTSDAAASTDLWCVPVRDGRAVGEERLVRTNVGAGNPLGFSKDGAYYFRKQNPGLDLVFVADSARQSDPTPEKTHITREFVNGTRPLWSRDGQSIAYIRKRPPDDDLVLYDTRDQVEQVLHKGLVLQDLVRVDARGVLAQHDFDSNRLRPLEITIATRLRTDRSPGESDLLRPPAAAVSLDGTTLYTAARSVPNMVGQQTRPGGPWDRLVSVDLETGAVTTLFRLPDNLATARTRPEIGLALSPDGLELAVAVQVESFRLARLFRVGIDGTGFRELYHPYRTTGPYGKVAWTTRGIYFSEVFGEMPTEFWRVQRLDPDRGSISTVVAINGTDSDSQFDPSPDGRQIAFHPSKTFAQPFSPKAGARNEIWRLDLSALVSSPQAKKQ